MLLEKIRKFHELKKYFARGNVYYQSDKRVNHQIVIVMRLPIDRYSKEDYSIFKTPNLNWSREMI